MTGYFQYIALDCKSWATLIVFPCFLYQYSRVSFLHFSCREGKWDPCCFRL